MSEISNSVWNIDKNGRWKLYFVPEQVLIYPEGRKDNMLTKDNKSLEQNLTLGDLVITPKGIGTIIKNIGGYAFIRFKQDIKEYKFLLNEISSYFNCYITFISNGIIDTIRIKLKISGNVSDIIKHLLIIKKINPFKYKYKFIYNQILLKKNNTFEKLNITNNSKILVLESKRQIKSKISRFKSIERNVPLRNQDGVSFSVSKDIELVGIGIYNPSAFRTELNGHLVILEGCSTMGKAIIKKKIEIKYSEEKTTVITKILFSKPILIKKDNDYSLLILPRFSTLIYTGGNGNAFIQGDKGANFTFKKLLGNKGQSNEICGNFPELYYYVKWVLIIAIFYLFNNYKYGRMIHYK